MHHSSKRGDRNEGQHSGGWICQPLIAPVNFPKKIRNLVENYLEEINKTQPRHAEGSGRVLRFVLGDKRGIKLATPQPPNQSFY